MLETEVGKSQKSAPQTPPNNYLEAKTITAIPDLSKTQRSLLKQAKYTKLRRDSMLARSARSICLMGIFIDFPFSF